MDEATMPSTTGAGASDAMSVYSELASLYPQSRPVSRHKNDPSETNTRPRAHSSAGILPPMPPLPSSEPPRRTFSVANFLNRSKSVSSPRVLEEKSTPNTFVGFCVGSTGRRFSFSAPPDSHTLHPYQQWTGPVTPGIDELYQQNEELSIIQSVSRLGIDTDPDEDGGVRLSMESSHESDSRGTSTSHSPNTTFTSELGTTTPESPPRPLHGRPHRLSLMSGSERASTLVGSDSEHEFGSDTLFDSIRTRISQLTPVRADAIFNFDGSASRTRSPTYAKSEGFFLGDDDETPVKRSTPQQASPDSARTARGVVPKISFDDDEDCWSTSDWNAPSRSGDVATNRLSAPSGLRPFNRLLTASQGALSSHSTESNTTYGTAQEVLSVASSREASSVLDWDDGNSVKASSPTRNSLRPKIIQAPENDISAYRPTHRLPNYQHARSQSMPLSQTLRGRVPSENWDDDFLDEDDEDGAGKGGMVIPRGIQERQASIIGHLGCVREFALLVEGIIYNCPCYLNAANNVLDLKRLRDDAIAKNIRYGADCLLWDEADGIIALATVDDDDDAKILQREKLQRQHTWAPGQTLEYTSPQKPTNAVPRRSVVLCPGDDIFGPQGPPTPTLAECQQASHTTSSPHRRIVDRNDPIEVAKSMMEKMQQHRAEKMGSQTDFEMSGKTHFDTDMLKDLVIHVNQLKRDLTRVISTTSPPGFLKMKPQPPDSEMEGRFNFSLTPRHSFDNRDALANGFDPLENGAMEFRSSAIGIAS